MKLSLQNRRLAQRGMTLWATLLTTGVIGFILSSYLTMVQVQHRSLTRSATWNSSLAYAEAGVEEALIHIKDNSGNLNSSGWTLSGTNYYKQRDFDDGYFRIAFSQSVSPTIYATGYTKMPTTEAYVPRAIRVTTTNDALFSKAMVSIYDINMSGNNIRVDSFDSADSRYSTLGQYDPLKAKDNGTIGSNSGNISGGNADVYGKIATGPTGTASVGNNGAVGNTAWHSGGNSGIQPGYYSNDMNITFDPVLAPFTSGATPSSGTVGLVNYGTILGNGNYSVSSLTGKILVTGNATLYVSSSINISGTDFLSIAPGGSLTVYMAGASTSFGGQGILNLSGNAANFQYYGLPSNTSIGFSGNATFVGTIYAPQADFTLSGGGSTVDDFIGASITKSVKMNGKYSFHYDENLARSGPGRGLVVISWNEL